MTNLRKTLCTLLSLLTLKLHLVKTSTKHLHADLAVLNLRTLVLRLNNGICWQVSNTNCGIRGVNALTARAGCAVRINTQVFLVDLNINLVSLWENCNGCG